MKHFMEFIGLPWKLGTTQKAELKATYRMGNTRPLTIDRTLVEFYCDEARAKIWVPEFTRTGFHEWFEIPHQSFDFAPGGSMLKIRNAARGNQAAYTVGIKPVA
jgi:hypothetical protein